MTMHLGVTVRRGRTMTKRELQALIEQLPPDLQQEVADFVEFLLRKRKRKGSTPLRQDWAGGLKDFREEYTALALQQKALEWRGD